MAALAAQTVISDDAITLTQNACAGGGDTVPGGTELRFRNTDAVTKTITVVTPGTVDANAIADNTFTVAQNASRTIRPNKRVYADPETGLVSLTYSAVTGLTVEVTH